MRFGAPCSDANACTAGDVCSTTGQCVSGAPLNCDDNNTCTVDSCDPARGCVHEAAPENICDGVDNDCDGFVDEGRVQATCSISPSTLNLNAQGSSFTIGCALTDVCDPAHPAPVAPTAVGRSYISRADGAADPADDATLPDPSTVACPDPVRGTLFERGIAENLATRDVTGNGITFRFNVPADGDCNTLDGDRQELQSRLAGVPDGAEAIVCVSGQAAGAHFEGCMGATVKNHGLR